MKRKIHTHTHTHAVCVTPPFRYLASESFGNQLRRHPLPLLLVDDVTTRSMTSIDVIRDGISHTRLGSVIFFSRETRIEKKWFNWFTCLLVPGTRFSLPPPFPHFFYRLILFVHTFRALQPLETDHKTPENNFFSSETQATLSYFWVVCFPASQ